MDGMYLASWMKEIGEKREAGMLWRKNGLLKAGRLHGRYWVQRKEIERFSKEMGFPLPKRIDPVIVSVPLADLFRKERRDAMRKRAKAS